MGQFNDLPKDIVWMIIVCFLKSSEDPLYPWTILEGHNSLHGTTGLKLGALVLVSQKWCQTIRSKCFKTRHGCWSFVNGTIKNFY